MTTDAHYNKAVASEKVNWAKYAALQSAQRLIITGNDTVFEIPVVIHVIHTGGAIGTPFNPTDQQLIDLIDFTNKAYQATWPSFPDVNNGGTYVPFRFVLAKRDPNCDSTNGIVRVDGSGLANYAAEGIELGGGLGASETAVKALSDWPHNKYYNIWVVNYIGGPGGGTAGYAYYPGAGQGVDGTVILAGVAQAGSTTLAHEIGHGMGLPHTFEGDNNGTTCPVNNNCNIDGDGICDTEPHMRGAGCNDPLNPCTNAPFGTTLHSFMSYSGGCRDRFTNGQRLKMHYNLMANRTLLMQSDGALPPPPQAATTCVPTSGNPGSSMNYGPQQVNFAYIAHTSGGFNTEGVYADNRCDQTEVYAGSSYLLSVKTGPNVENVRVYIDYDNDGNFTFPELVLNHNGTTANEVHTATVTIPATGATLCTPLRMRVLSDIPTNSFILPCGVLDRGQAEDYVVKVKPPSTATLAAVSASTFPYCKDSMVYFTVNTTGVPAGSPVSWFVNGVKVGSGNVYGSASLSAGDQVFAKVVVNNPTCNTPDTLTSAALSISFLPGPAAPVISFINGNLVSNISPVLWFGPNGLIPGVTSAVYHPTQFGNYYAIALGNPCPSDSSNVLNVSLLDIESVTAGSLRVYPNPAASSLRIESTEGVRPVSLSVYNLVGKLVKQYEFSGKDASISVADLSNGLYFISVTDAVGARHTVRIEVLH